MRKYNNKYRKLWKMQNFILRLKPFCFCISFVTYHISYIKYVVYKTVRWKNISFFYFWPNKASEQKKVRETREEPLFFWSRKKVNLWNEKPVSCSQFAFISCFFCFNKLFLLHQKRFRISNVDDTNVYIPVTNVRPLGFYPTDSSFLYMKSLIHGSPVLIKTKLVIGNHNRKLSVLICDYS